MAELAGRINSRESALSILLVSEGSEPVAARAA